MAPMMPEDEILQLYREAKDKKKEIRILADMNCTTSKEMRNWLIEKGINVPEDKRFKNDADFTPQEDIPKEANVIEIPESIRRILNERRRHLIEQIQKLQSEVNDINSFIGDYRKDKQ